MQKLSFDLVAVGERAAGIGGHQCSVTYPGLGRCQGGTRGVYHQTPTGAQLIPSTLPHSISKGCSKKMSLFEDRNFSFAFNFLLLTEKFAVLEAIFSHS